MTNVHFKSILEPYKCQIVKFFWGFAPNLIGDLHNRFSIPNGLIISNSQFGANGLNCKFQAHTLVCDLENVMFFLA